MKNKIKLKTYYKIKTWDELLKIKIYKKLTISSIKLFGDNYYTESEHLGLEQYNYMLLETQIWIFSENKIDLLLCTKKVKARDKAEALLKFAKRSKKIFKIF